MEPGKTFFAVFGHVENRGPQHGAEAFDSSDFRNHVHDVRAEIQGDSIPLRFLAVDEQTLDAPVLAGWVFHFNPVGLAAKLALDSETLPT